MTLLSKRAGDIIEQSGIPHYIIEDLRNNFPDNFKTRNYWKTNIVDFEDLTPPIKTNIIEKVEGNIPLPLPGLENTISSPFYRNHNPNPHVFWSIQSNKLEPSQRKEYHYKIEVLTVIYNEKGQMLVDQMLRELGPKLNPLFEKLKHFLIGIEEKAINLIKQKRPELFNIGQVIPFPVSKRAAIEPSTMGVGVSTSVRKYVRNYYARSGVDAMSSMRNKELNDVIASDFMKAELIHKFKLKSGEIAFVKKSHSFYYIGAVRKGGGRIDVITVQSTIKQPSEEVRKKRLETGWGGVLH